MKLLSHPVLYSYRRCPYAMRARMAIYVAGLQVEQREIVFWQKPEPMLQASPKGTVPVLVLPDENGVIDESWDIVKWAFNHADSQAEANWYQGLSAEQHGLAEALIADNDGAFKTALDCYKYADRFPDKTPLEHREAGLFFLTKLNNLLSNSSGLLGEPLSYADLSVCTFVRQFMNVDVAWREGEASEQFPFLMRWLQGISASEVFVNIMKNRPVWEAAHQPLWVDEPLLTTKNEFRDKALLAEAH